MKKIVALLLASSIFCSSVFSVNPALGEDVQQSDDPGKITPLKKGQAAPYPGVLFSPKAAAVVAAELSTMKDKTKIEVAAAVGSAEAKKDFKIAEINAACKADKTALNAQIDEKDKTIAFLTKELKVKEEDAPSRTVWGSIGFVAGVAVSAVFVFLASGIGSSAK